MYVHLLKMNNYKVTELNWHPSLGHQPRKTLTCRELCLVSGTQIERLYVSRCGHHSREGTDHVSTVVLYGVSKRPLNAGCRSFSTGCTVVYVLFSFFFFLYLPLVLQANVVLASFMLSSPTLRQL